jgi:hypothetical protein
VRWWWQALIAVGIAAVAAIAFFFLMLTAVLVGTNEENINPEACRDVGGTPVVQSGVLICVVVQQPAQNGET